MTAFSFVLASLGFHAHVEASELPEETRLAAMARFPVRAGEPTAAITLVGSPDPVGIVNATSLAEAALEWTSASTANLRCKSAEVALSIAPDGHVTARGRVFGPRAVGGLEALFRAIAVVSLTARDVLVVHASAVDFGAAGAVLFYGASGDGKTTTARRLGREGGRRIADDMVAVDLRGTEPLVAPLPFERRGRTLHRTEVAPSRIAGALVVKKGAAETRVVSLAEATKEAARALIALPFAPGSEVASLARFARFAALRMAAIEAAPSGPLAPAVRHWLSTLP